MTLAEVLPMLRNGATVDDVFKIAEKMAARGFASPLGGAGPQTPEETAEHFGREMFRLHGKAWPQMIALASGAAMREERDAMGDVK